MGNPGFAIGDLALPLKGLAAAEAVGRGGGRMDPASIAGLYGSRPGVWDGIGTAGCGDMFVVEMLVAIVESLGCPLDAAFGQDNPTDESMRFDNDPLEYLSVSFGALGFDGALKSLLRFAGVCADICADGALT